MSESEAIELISSLDWEGIQALYDCPETSSEVRNICNLWIRIKDLKTLEQQDWNILKNNEINNVTVGLAFKVANNQVCASFLGNYCPTDAVDVILDRILELKEPLQPSILNVAKICIELGYRDSLIRYLVLSGYCDELNKLLHEVDIDKGELYVAYLDGIGFNCSDRLFYLTI